MEQWNLIKKLQDGTIVYKNPFARTESWYVPERKHRPSLTNAEKKTEALVRHEPEDYCAFCPARYLETTPEKSRLENSETGWRLIEQPAPQHIFTHYADLRRINNLFSIISFEYWKKNYGYQLAPADTEHKRVYLADPLGREHIRALVFSTRRNGRHSSSKAPSAADIDRRADAYFGGSHELIIPQRHYVNHAADTGQLCGAGSLSREEHFNYFRLTCYAVERIYSHNPFVTFVSVYTNWRRDAGATFEHLHRQVIGVDTFGQTLHNGLALAGKNPRVYQDYVNYVALAHHYRLAENEHAVAFVDIGQTFATAAIYSKSAQTLPFRHTAEELRGMSDLVHAVHAAFGPDEAVNEEWYYRPPRAAAAIPWHVLIKWRNHRHAGIEATTDIFPDEYGPDALKELLLARMIELSRQNKISATWLGDESGKETIRLRYAESS